jgi:hypothetical protein
MNFTGIYIKMKRRRRGIKANLLELAISLAKIISTDSCFFGVVIMEVCFMEPTLGVRVVSLATDATLGFERRVFA